MSAASNAHVPPALRGPLDVQSGAGGAVWQ